MREEIERVIEDLQLAAGMNRRKQNPQAQGMAAAYDDCISMLKAVLANGENDISREAWEQSPEYKRFTQRVSTERGET